MSLNRRPRGLGRGRSTGRRGDGSAVHHTLDQPVEQLGLGADEPGRAPPRPGTTRPGRSRGTPACAPTAAATPSRSCCCARRRRRGRPARPTRSPPCRPSASRCRARPARRSGRRVPVSSSNSRSAHARGSSSGSYSPLGIDHAPRSFLAQNGPPGCTSSTSGPPSRDAVQHDAGAAPSRHRLARGLRDVDAEVGGDEVLHRLAPADQAPVPVVARDDRGAQVAELRGLRLLVGADAADDDGVALGQGRQVGGRVQDVDVAAQRAGDERRPGGRVVLPRRLDGGPREERSGQQVRSPRRGRCSAGGRAGA